jgi:NACHT domain
LLWIFGQPGAGKTFLSSKIIHHLQCEEMSSTTFVAYFFIKEDNQDLKSIDNILKSIAFQIAQSDLLFRKFVLKVCKNSENLRNLQTFWNKVFQDFFGSPRCSSFVFVVLDGVDEAPRQDRETLLGLLHGLHSLRASFERPKIQIAVIGRPDLQNDIFRQWGELVEHVDVSADRNKADIERYIMQEVDKVQMLRSKRLSIKDKNNLRQLIVDKLREGADGMFQWIKLVLAKITHKKVKTDIIHALKAMPADLLEMIGRIFDRITKDADIPQHYFGEMLLWIACAKRPLTLGELQELLTSMPREGGESSPDSTTGEDDIVNDWPDLETDLRTTFVSFLALTRADGKTTETLQKERIGRPSRIQEEYDEQGSGHLNANGNDLEYSDASEEDDEPSSEFRGQFNSHPHSTEIQFSHASIRDFLFREQSLMPEYVKVDQNQAHTRIAIGCLVLITVNFRMIGKNGRAPYSYAMHNWADHLAQADPSKVQLEDRARVLMLLFRVLHDPDNALQFFHYCCTYINYRKENFQHICETLLQVTNNWASEDILSTLSSQESSWVAKAKTSISNLFECVALAVAQNWLQTWKTLDEYHSPIYIELLRECFPMVCIRVFFITV